METIRPPPNMAAIESVCLPHLSEYPLYVALFAGVENAQYLRKQLLEANADFEYAFLDASMVQAS